MASLGFAAETKPLSGSRPNIILLLTDDQGLGDLSCTGNPYLKTPNLDRIHALGSRFTDFHVSPGCSPTRSAIMSGRHEFEVGVTHTIFQRERLAPGVVTIAEALRRAGYSTGLFGKWHLGNPNDKNDFSPNAFPLAHGFDAWLGTNVSHDYSNAKLLKSDPAGTHPIKGYAEITSNLPSHPDACASLTALSTEAALAFIEKNKAEPFFAYIPFNMPHLGIYCSKPFQGKSRRGPFGDVMEEIDDSVGRIRQALDEAGITKNTLIIFSSDNGPWIKFSDIAESKYGDARLAVGYAQPFRDGKGSTWEGGHRVPGIFCWPGTIAPNSVELNPASTLDVLPTIFALAGAAMPQDRSIDGRDIRHYLMPAESTGNVPEFKFFYSDMQNNPSAVRIGPWKMHTRIISQTGNNYGFKASRTHPLLFQVEHDLGERIDRAGDEAEVINTLQVALSDFEAQIKQEGTFWDKK